MLEFYLMAIAGNLSTIACILFFVSLFAPKSTLIEPLNLFDL